MSVAPLVARAYTVVPNKDDEASGFPVTTAVQLAGESYRSLSTEFSDSPEARELTWTDDFFDCQDDVIAVFDLDYEKMEKHAAGMSWAILAGTALIPVYGWPFTAIGLLLGIPCFARTNARETSRCQHVAITRDGITVVNDKHRRFAGFPCSDSGKSTRTIPFDKISEVMVSEPGGNHCICVPNTISTVILGCGDSGDSKTKLSILGLKEPEAFKKLLLAVKRSYHPPAASLPVNIEMADRNRSEHNHQGDQQMIMSTLLREMRDELRQSNAAQLKSTGEQEQSP